MKSSFEIIVGRTEQRKIEDFLNKFFINTCAKRIIVAGVVIGWHAVVNTDDPSIFKKTGIRYQKM